MSDCTQQFVNYLVDQTPHFDTDIIRDLSPQTGTWIGRLETGTWESFMGNTHYFDRFTQVFANPTRQWTAKEYEACTGNPCDPSADEICWGNVRQSYFKETRSIETQLLCFDQIRDVSHAKEHASQIVEDILRPATDTIMSYYMKKRSAEHAGKKWMANDTMDDFTYEWVVVGDDEVYIKSDADPTDIFKLAPQMLQRRVTPLTLKGYMQQRVFEGFPNLIELITDTETVWDLDKQANTGTVNLAQYWRYQDWAQANAYWKYGFGGQLGNYAVAVDPFALRFNYNPADTGDLTLPYRYDLVLPYKNVDAGTQVYEGASFESGTGLRMVENEDYELAQYQFSFIHHRRSARVFVADAAQINPNMPFGSRNLAGQWQFANTELGCENIRKNKGKFYADFELAFKPTHPAWEELIFHKREPACVPEVETCNDDPGYPEQSYNSACDPCDEGPWGPTEPCEEGEGLALTAVTISGIPIALDATTFGEDNCFESCDTLTTAMNADPTLSLMGTWDCDSDNAVILTDPTVHGVSVTVVCCERGLE